MSNALAPSQLLSTLLGLLPPEVGVLDNATAAIALLAHAIHTALGFRLVKPAATDSEASSSTDPQVRNKLSKDWVDRASGDESFALSYRHEQSSLLFEARIGRLGGRIVVNAVAVEDDKTATLDLTTNDYTSASNYPKDVREPDFKLNRCSTALPASQTLSRYTSLRSSRS